ncbi:hypothetical protein C7M84_018630 [Penaeus vannamei]|uniref:Uncharacterized protein n=1 Tax=Penaeus vannamei TaxID=6689 RepID=A0A3R7P818_PENVA|nr:hypothetical protein C7M84_018630 [Penaeus vannamei]
MKAGPREHQRRRSNTVFIVQVYCARVARPLPPLPFSLPLPCSPLVSTPPLLAPPPLFSLVSPLPLASPLPCSPLVSTLLLHSLLAPLPVLPWSHTPPPLPCSPWSPPSPPPRSPLPVLPPRSPLPVLPPSLLPSFLPSPLPLGFFHSFPSYHQPPPLHSPPLPTCPLIQRATRHDSTQSASSGEKCAPLPFLAASPISCECRPSLAFLPHPPLPFPSFLLSFSLSLLLATFHSPVYLFLTSFDPFPFAPSPSFSHFSSLAPSPHPSPNRLFPLLPLPISAHLPPFFYLPSSIALNLLSPPILPIVPPSSPTLISLLPSLNRPSFPTSPISPHFPLPLQLSLPLISPPSISTLPTSPSPSLPRTPSFPSTPPPRPSLPTTPPLPRPSLPPSPLPSTPPPLPRPSPSPSLLPSASPLPQTRPGAKRALEPEG